jgi:putative nucleotidyltransferase with HDIG domain
VAVLVTTLVAVLPAILATRLVASHGVASLVASAALAAALSAASARACAAVWARKPIFADVLFSDLMVWAWVRRRVNEWRLGRIRRRLIALAPREAPMPVAALARMGRLLEARHAGTYGHSRRVARHAQTIARALHLSAGDVERIRLAATVHDIGKIYTPREILDKPGRLTDAEFDLIKRHPGEGVELLSHIEDPELLAMVRHHHERLDGQGYPDRLSGEQIPLGARIIAVADTFDALTSARPYRPAATHKVALAILDAEAGHQLDADAVAAFRRHYTASRSAALVAVLATGADRVFSWLGGGSLGLGAGAASLAQALPAAGATAVLALGAPAAPVTGGSADLRPSAPKSVRVASSPAMAPKTNVVARGAAPSSPPAPSRHRTSSTNRTARTPARSPKVLKHPPSGPATPAGGQAPAPLAKGPAAAAQAPATVSDAGASEVTVPAVAAPAPAPPVSSVTSASPTSAPPSPPIDPVVAPRVSTPQVSTPVVTVPSVSVSVSVSVPAPAAAADVLGLR